MMRIFRSTLIGEQACALVIAKGLSLNTTGMTDCPAIGAPAAFCPSREGIFTCTSGVDGMVGRTGSTLQGISGGRQPELDCAAAEDNWDKDGPVNLGRSAAATSSEMHKHRRIDLVNRLIRKVSFYGLGW